MLILMCLINCLFVFANVQPIDQLQKQVNNVQYVESKSRQNYVRTPSGYYEYGTSDLFSYDFANAIINYYSENLGNSFLSITNDDVGQYVIQTNNVYKVYFYNQNSEYQLVIDVKNIVLQKDLWPTQSATSGLQPKLYSLIFSNNSPYNRSITFEYTCQRTSNNQLQIMGNGFFVSNDVAQDFIYPNSARFMLSEDGNSRDAFIYDLVNKSHTDDYNSGYQTGYDDGYGNAVSTIENDPLNDVYQSIYGTGYQSGYNEGLQVGLDTDSTALTIMTGIVEVGLLPINVLLKMFEYEVFGVNIAGVVSGLFTIAIVVIVIRMITGKKND